jgi:S-adenosylmethionine-diacylglycerol 3-amino-3-carboxypropyl transferase
VADADRPLASRLNYAQCWEDVAVLGAALAVGPGDDVLSIASAGDNAFALAATGARVVAADLSEPQLALCELKLTAARALDHAAWRVLFGLDGGDRLDVYRSLRDGLPDRSRRWFDAHGDDLAEGVLGSGRFERYLAAFRTRVLPLIHRRRTVEGWFELPDRVAQQRYFEHRWDGLRWRTLFRLFFSRRVMAARGRSREQFAHVDGPVADALLARARRVMTELPIRDNGYVQWMLLGRWVSDRAAPPWLTAQGQRALAESADRITLVHGPIQAMRGKFSAFNLSDVPEYLSVAETRGLYDAVLESARPGARIAYWNLFVPRQRPPELADRVEPQVARALDLHRRDRAFVYGAFRLEVVR